MFSSINVGCDRVVGRSMTMAAEGGGLFLISDSTFRVENTRKSEIASKVHARAVSSFVAGARLTATGGKKTVVAKKRVYRRYWRCRVRADPIDEAIKIRYVDGDWLSLARICGRRIFALAKKIVPRSPSHGTRPSALPSSKFHEPAHPIIPRRRASPALAVRYFLYSSSLPPPAARSRLPGESIPRCAGRRRRRRRRRCRRLRQRRRVAFVVVLWRRRWLAKSGTKNRDGAVPYSSLLLLRLLLLSPSSPLPLPQPPTYLAHGKPCNFALPDNKR
jgi:hypothetical protein